MMVHSNHGPSIPPSLAESPGGSGYKLRVSSPSESRGSDTTAWVGTLIGANTIFDTDQNKDFSYLIDGRVLKIVAHGMAIAQFLGYADYIKIEMLNIIFGRPVFCVFKQEVTSWQM